MYTHIPVIVMYPSSADCFVEDLFSIAARNGRAAKCIYVCVYIYIYCVYIYIYTYTHILCNIMLFMLMFLIYV